MLSESFSDVNGPDAIMHIPSGISVISPVCTVILGCAFILSVIVFEKLYLSTAKAPPAGTLH